MTLDIPSIDLRRSPDDTAATTRTPSQPGAGQRTARDRPARHARARSPRNERRAVVFGISPTLVGDERSPARTKRVLVIRIAAKPQKQLVVLTELVAIELHAEPRLGRHGNRPAAVMHP